MLTTPLGVARTLCHALGSRLARLPLPWFCALAVGIAFVRWGGTIGPVFTGLFRDAAYRFPEPNGWLGSSLGVILLMKGLGYPGDLAWERGGLVVYGLVVLGLLLWTTRTGAWQRVAILLLVASPGFGMLTNLTGHYDYFTLLGSLAVALSRTKRAITAGACVAVLGNPEQVLVSALCLTVLGLSFPSARIRAAIMGGIATIWLCFLALLYGGASGRLDTGGHYHLLATALRRFLADWPLAIWAFLGPLWLVLLVTLLAMRRSVLPALVGVVGIPAAASIVTIDGTRVFVAISCASLAFLIHEVWRTRWATEVPSNEVLGATFLLLILSPAVHLFPGAPGLLVQPYDYALARHLGWSLNADKFSSPLRQ